MRFPIACLLCFAAAVATARPNFVSRIPNGDINACANCHLRPGGTGEHTTFGDAFDANGRVWSTALAGVDSDGDGFTNGAELFDDFGLWSEGSDPPGDPYLVSSPGRASSILGERLLQISEIHQTVGGEYRVELTNLSNQNQPLDEKWLVFGPFVGTNIAGDRNIGQTKVSPVDGPLPPLAPGERVVVTLNLDEMDPSAISSARGFVGLGLFENQADLPVTGVDFSLENIIGDYVEWGTTGNEQPYSFTVSQCFLPQWDSVVGAPVTLKPGGSIEFALAGDGVRAYFEAPIELTLNRPRPTPELARFANIQFPNGELTTFDMPFGFEATNLQDAASPSWPAVQAVLTLPPDIPASLPGEKVFRVSSYRNRAFNFHDLEPGLFRIVTQQIEDSAVATIQWEQCYTSLATTEPTRTSIDLYNGIGFRAALFEITANDQGLVAILEDPLGTRSSRQLIDVGDGPREGRWFRFVADVEINAASQSLTADVRMFQRTGQLIANESLVISGIDPTNLFRFAAFIVQQPATGAFGEYDTYFTNLRYGALPTPTGFMMR